MHCLLLGRSTTSYGFQLYDCRYCMGYDAHSGDLVSDTRSGAARSRHAHVASSAGLHVQGHCPSLLHVCKEGSIKEDKRLGAVGLGSLRRCAWMYGHGEGMQCGAAIQWCCGNVTRSV